MVHLSFFGKQGAFLKALTNFYRAAKPDCTRVTGKKTKDNEAIVAHLKAEGVLGRHLEGYTKWTAPIQYNDASGLDNAHADIEVGSVEDMRAILARQDVEHIVSLKLRFDANVMSKEVFKVMPARWDKLRSVEVSSGWIADETDISNLLQGLGTWLEDARPVVVNIADAPLKIRLLQAGVYKRAFGTSLKLPSKLQWSDLKSWLSGDLVRVSRLEQGYGMSREVSSLEPLLGCMSDELREVLMGLQWPLALDELPVLNELIGKLPALTTLHAENGQLQAERDALLDAFAASPETRRLGVFVPVLWSSSSVSRVTALNAGQIKRLTKGDGLQASNFLLASPGSSPSI